MGLCLGVSVWVSLCECLCGCLCVSVSMWVSDPNLSVAEEPEDSDDETLHLDVASGCSDDAGRSDRLGHLSGAADNDDDDDDEDDEDDDDTSPVHVRHWPAGNHGLRGAGGRGGVWSRRHITAGTHFGPVAATWKSTVTHDGSRQWKVSGQHTHISLLCTWSTVLLLLPVPACNIYIIVCEKNPVTFYEILSVLHVIWLNCACLLGSFKNKVHKSVLLSFIIQSLVWQS